MTNPSLLQVWKVGGPPLVVLVLAFGFMIGGHFEGSLGLIGSALVVFMVTLSADAQRRDHKRCLDELVDVRRGLTSQSRHLSQFRQALLVYLISDETADDKATLLDAIGRGLDNNPDASATVLNT